MVFNVRGANFAITLIFVLSLAPALVTAACWFETDETTCTSGGNSFFMRWAGVNGSAHPGLLNHTSFAGVVCCDNLDTGTNNSLYLSGPGSSEHVSNDSATYGSTYAIPTNGTCFARNTTCQTGEFCAVQLSSLTVGHIADCATGSLTNNLCCQGPSVNLTEICTNGIDDDGDGYADCADDDCNEIGGTVMECTGSPQTSGACYSGAENCTGSTGFDYYCSYGVDESLAAGRCCETGKFWDEFTSSCRDASPCYPNPPHICSYDYSTENTNWLPDSSCSGIGNSPSQACCQVIQFGNLDYYSNAGNVVIY